MVDVLQVMELVVNDTVDVTASCSDTFTHKLLVAGIGKRCPSSFLLGIRPREIGCACGMQNALHPRGMQ